MTPVSMIRSNASHKVASLLASGSALAALLVASSAGAVSSAELYTSKGYSFGRIDARVQFAAGDGVVSSFFMWKDGSEQSSVFWNELDFEKLRANCELETNALYGLPQATHNATYDGTEDLCGVFHTYTYEWTPEYIAWFIDGVEIRREVGDVAAAYAENAANGMQIRFNIWPGDASFGGNFDPAILPVHEYINWVQYSSYADGAFKLEWREDFNGTTKPSGWATANWESPKGLSKHAPGNVTFINGYAVLSLTPDDALGSEGAAPFDATDDSPVAGAPGTDPPVSGSAGMATAAGGAGAGAPSGGAGVAPDDRSGSAGGCSSVPGAGSGMAWSWAVVGLALAAGLTRRRAFHRTQS